MNQNFEIFPTLKELKESILQAFEQHLNKNMVCPDELEYLNDEERKK